MAIKTMLGLVLLTTCIVSPAEAFPKFTSHARTMLARSACPGLNALANHGLLPRDGRNITLERFTAGATAGFNFDEIPPVHRNQSFAQQLFDAAVTFNPYNPSRTSFDLDTINTHNFPLEIDGSVSRNDNFFGDAVSYNSVVFRRFWTLLEAQGSENETFIDIPRVAKARAQLVLEKSKKFNPQFIFNSTTRDISLGTSSLFMMNLGGGSGVVRKDFVWSLFDQERLPYELGWRPQHNVSFDTFLALRNAIYDATPADIPCTFNPETFCTPENKRRDLSTQLSTFH